MRILFFSVLKDIVGADSIERDLPSELPVSELLEGLYEEWPALRDWDGKLLLAADHDFVDRDAVVRDTQEIAIMPPVQGG